MRRLLLSLTILCLVPSLLGLGSVDTSAALTPIIVLPSQVAFGPINAAVDPAAELKGGLSVVVSQLQPFGATTPETSSARATLRLFVLQPPKEKQTGVTLPVERLRCGVDNLQSMTTTGLQIPTLAGVPVSIRLGIQLELTDPAGAYEARLGLSGADPTIMTEIPVTFEARKWVRVKDVTNPTFLAAANRTTGPDSFLSSGLYNIALVASNCKWVLTARPEGPFEPQSGPGTKPIAQGDVSLKVFASDKVSPRSTDFVAMGAQPTLLAAGLSTCGAWVPIKAEMRLPFSRQQPAGKYAGFVEYVIVPAD